MTDDIVARLRSYAYLDDAFYNPWVYAEAADEIERMRAALNDVAQFIPHGLWHFVKSDTLTLLREGKTNE